MSHQLTVRFENRAVFAIYEQLMNGTAENSWLARQLPAAALVAEFVRRESCDRDLDRHVITPHLCVPTPTCRLWSIKYLETEIAQPWMVVRATAERPMILAV
jgi:hypothetical protein